MYYQLNSFKNQGLMKNETPFVSIGYGSVYFNVRILELIGFRTKWVTVDIDYDNKFIKVKPLKKRNFSSLPLEGVKGTIAKRLNNSNLVNIKIAKIINDIKGKVRRYLVEWWDKEQILVIDLNYEV